MSTLKSKRRKRARTRRLQRGGGFFDRFTEKLTNFNIPNPFNQVKENFKSVVSRVRGSFCPPCPKPESISPSTNLSKKSEKSENKLISQTRGGKNHKKRKTIKKRVSKK
jgi:hypothetical protein